MKKLILGIWILLFIATAGYSQESMPTLLLSIKPDKQVYEVGEEIVLKWEIKNDYRTGLIVLKPFQFVGQCKDLIIKGPKGEYEYKGPLKEWVWGRGDFVTLKPADTVMGAYRIESKYFTLTDVGIYNITYKFQGVNPQELNLNVWAGALSSNTITIKVNWKARIPKEESR